MAVGRSLFVELHPVDRCDGSSPGYRTRATASARAAMRGPLPYAARIVRRVHPHQAINDLVRDLGIPESIAEIMAKGMVAGAGGVRSGFGEEPGEPLLEPVAVPAAAVHGQLGDGPGASPRRAPGRPERIIGWIGITQRALAVLRPRPRSGGYMPRLDVTIRGKQGAKSARDLRKLLGSQRVAGALVPPAGLEPARPCGQQILSLPRLPFRHGGPHRCRILGTRPFQETSAGPVARIETPAPTIAIACRA
jgi:hypothetical protein